MRTSILDTRVSHLIFGVGGDDPLPAEVRQRIKDFLLRRNDCPEEEIEGIDLALLRLVHPYRADGMLGLAREQFGSRRKIRRAEMREYLARLNVEGFLDLAKEWPIEAPDGDLARAWADACTDITVISLIDYATDLGAPSSSNQGMIRYDQPGSMEPQLRATMMFVPVGLMPHSGDYLRRHCRRLIEVT